MDRNTPNQAMERMATRRAFTFWIARIFLPQVTRGFRGRRSSYSR
jgi:hypothetical protein